MPDKTGYATLPNLSRLTLGDRNPMSASVRNDLAKAAALAAEFGLVLDCALSDAAALHDQLLNSLAKDAAHRLVDRTRVLYRSLKIEPEAGSTDQRDRTVLH